MGHDTTIQSICFIGLKKGKALSLSLSGMTADAAELCRFHLWFIGFLSWIRSPSQASSSPSEPSFIPRL